MRIIATAIVVTVCSAGSVMADFSYEQTSKVTGGMMAGMMKFAGAFSKQAREPMKSKVIVKGDRMAMVDSRKINVIDLNQETFTDIDLEKKTYAVMTFADMTRAMGKMSEKMGQKGNDADVSFKANVKETGATRSIGGFDAKETILTLEMQGTDKKTGNSGGMVIDTDMWVAPSMPGYNEVQSFYQRMAQKMAWTPGGGMFAGLMAQQPGANKGFAEIAKEASKIDGIPVLQIIRMRPTGSGQGMPSEKDMAEAQRAMEQAQAQQQQQAPPPTAGEVATDAAAQAGTSAATNKMKLGGVAGALGGFGGFGRKKKPAQEEAPQASAPQQQASASSSAPASATPPGTLMELTTEMTGFSSAPVDSSQFEVPTGFKQVEHDMQKALK